MRIERIELRRQVTVPADGLREIEGADDGVRALRGVSFDLLAGEVPGVTKASW